MIYTVTLNPAIDYMIEASTFNRNSVNLYKNAYYTAGGKAVNVSLLLTSLGMQNTALGIAAGFSGEEIVRLLEENGVLTDFVFLDSGHSRINLKICNAGGIETDFNGAGPMMNDAMLDSVIAKLSRINPGDTLVLAGSLPEGISDNAYERIIEAVSGKKPRIIVDAVGDALERTLHHRPFMVKPNAEELGGLFGVSIKNEADARLYGRKLCDMGAQNAVVSLGEAGAILIEGSGEISTYPTLKGGAVSTVGAGDSLVAGFIYGMERENNLPSAVKWGVAAGTATAFKKGIATAEEVFHTKNQIDFNVKKT